MRLNRICNRVLNICAIGNVTIDEKIGKPGIEHVEPCFSFWCVRFEVVSIEIEILRGHPPAHLLGAILIRPVVGTEALVAIDVEDGHEDDGRLR